MGRSLRALYLRGTTSPSSALAELLARDFDDVSLLEVDSLTRFDEASADGFDVFLADYAVTDGTGIDAWNLRLPLDRKYVGS